LGASSLLRCDESEKSNHLPIYKRFSIENNLEEYIRLNYEFYHSVSLKQSVNYLDKIYSEQPDIDVNSKPLEYMPVTQNLSRLSKYSIFSDPIGLMRDIQMLNMENRMEEFMFLGLRLCKGISKRDFLERFHITIEDIYGDVIKKLISQKLLQEDEDRLKLTDYGIDVSNVVLSEFLLDE
jgi:oxygen-independent coproporphyrinogen-3 oxidase